MSEPDNLLIAEFNARRSEAAFAALVRQHVSLVFATAFRQAGDAGAAEEITQNVFMALAQAAGRLGSHPTIAGWLHQTALNKSREWLRSELRRRKREQVAVNLQTARAEGDSVWSSLVPMLDEALLELRDVDRQAVILHFLEGRNFQEVGSVLGVGEDAARKRVDRCLGQLTNFFRRQGFATPALTASAPLFALSSHAVPAGLAASATSAGLAAHSTASTLTLIKGALKVMAWTKMKTTVVAGVGILIVVGTMVAVLESKARTDRKKDIVAYEILHQPLLARQAGDNETRRQLEGVWIITDKRFQGNPRFAHYPKDNPHLKTWTLTNWAIVTYDSKSNIVYSASGPYELDGNLYTETVESGTGTMTNYIGAQLQYKLRVEEGKYYQMGSGIEETGERVHQ